MIIAMHLFSQRSLIKVKNNKFCNSLPSIMQQPNKYMLNIKSQVVLGYLHG